MVLVDQLSSALRRAEVAQRQAEDALDAQRTMFLEFQHRVANSLQSVAGLLAVERKRVQAGETDPGETLSDAARRLQAMARLHRRLYDPDTARRDFRAVVAEVCEELRVAMGAEAVEFDVDIPDRVSIGVERLLPLALLVAEAVTNSLKHAYTAGRAGTIRISLLALARHYELTVRDDGPGLPKHPVVQAGQESLGMMVMRSLAQRLGGRLEVLSDRGTVTRLTFPTVVRT